MKTAGTCFPIHNHLSLDFVFGCISSNYLENVGFSSEAISLLHSITKKDNCVIYISRCILLEKVFGVWKASNKGGNNGNYNMMLILCCVREYDTE